MYDPVQGRFIQEDSYRGDVNNPLSLNLYTYCENNPLLYDDQNGHWPKWIQDSANWVKDKVSSFVSGVKDTLTGWKDSIVSTSKKVISSVSKGIDKVTNFVKNINLDQLITGVTSTIIGVSGIAIGIAALPIPGAQVAGITMISSGIGSISYGMSEAIDSVVHVNPLKSFFVNNLGLSEDTYHMFGLVSAEISSVGAATFSPLMRAGSSKGIPKTSKNSSSDVKKQLVDRPVVESNSGSMLKGLSDKGVAKPKWWHPGYVDDLTDSQIILGVKQSPKGLSTLGSSTRSEALRAGEAWTGNGAVKMIDKATGELIGFKSADGMRAFRIQYKSKEGMFRANFQQNEMIRTQYNVNTELGWGRKEISNVHIDIID